MTAASASNAYALIMAGGSGERFWPLSTPERPKQFLDLFGGQPMIRLAVDRLAGLIPAERIFVITADRLVPLTREVLPMIAPENILGEPCRRDTAAAVATACGIVLKKGGPDAVGCILTADALIEPAESFRQTLADAICAAATSDAVVTMGIRPTRPETGFGYIACGEVFPSNGETTIRRAQRFVEKPDVATATRYLEEGNYLWNAGLFVWRAAVMHEAFRRHAADIEPLIAELAVAEDAKAVVDRLYPDLRRISVDFAVMERLESVLVAECGFVWDDVGSWRAVENHFPADADGNILLGAAVLHNCRGVTAVNRCANRVLAVDGLSDAVVVQTEEATLVCSKDETAKLKALVEKVARAK